MGKEEYLSKIEFGIAYIAFGFVLLFQYSRAFSEEELMLFVELMMAYVWTAGLFIYAKFRFDIHIFEPITMITAIYEGIFVVKPIIDLRNHEMIEHGISVIGGGHKATLLFALGFTAFFFAYYLNHRHIVYRGHPIFRPASEKQDFRGDWLPWLYGAWAVTYILCLSCMLTQGLSLRYIFSFGTDGIRSADENKTALLFLSNFGITLVTLWLMILEYSRNKAVKISTTVLCVIYLLMRNARWLMLVFIVAPITLRYLKKGKQPRLLWVVLLGVGGLAIFAWMQANRAILASGGAMQGWGADGFTLGKLLAPLESDLSTYRTFYSMVERFPAEYSYMLGQTFLYVFVLFIPRAIWAGKPDNPVRDMIERSLNKRARVSGTAVANIGEFYANFGVLGIVAFMYLIGWITSSLKHAIFNSIPCQNKAESKYIAYSIIFPLFFQWIARGNFSGNFYMTIFAMLPFIVISMAQSLKRKE